jgi:hypothetical protein
MRWYVTNYYILSESHEVEAETEEEAVAIGKAIELDSVDPTEPTYQYTNAEKDYLCDCVSANEGHVPNCAALNTKAVDYNYRYSKFVRGG